MTTKEDLPLAKHYPGGAYSILGAEIIVPGHGRRKMEPEKVALRKREIAQAQEKSKDPSQGGEQR